MKRFRFLFLLATPALAAEPLSLFLTEAERHQFNQEINLGAFTTSPKSVTLKAVMITDPDHWSIWINDLRISPDTRSEDVEIISVSAGEVELIWKKDCEPQKINLRTNESVVIGEGNQVSQE